MRKPACPPLSNLPLAGILTMNVPPNVLASVTSADASQPPSSPAIDGRQSAAAIAIARGTARYLHALGYCVVSELPLPSGRRADLVALGGDGEIIVVEIKSSVADFRWIIGGTAIGCSSPHTLMCLAIFSPPMPA